MSHRRTLVLAVACGAVLWAAPAAAQTGTVEEVIVQGLGRMSEEAFLQAFGIRPGAPYDVARIRERYHALWELGLFSEITIEAEDAPKGGKALIVKVVERPTLNSVSYEENKVLTQTQIEDRLTEKHLELQLGRPLDMKRIYEVESTIRDYLGEKGFVDAQVSHEVRGEPHEPSRSVFFYVRPGGKTKIKSIDFVGNALYSDRQLKKELTLTKPYRWYWPWSSKSLYHPLKWDQDVGAVRDLYQNSGYLDVEIKPPVVDVIPSKKEQKRKAREGAKEPEVSPKKVEKYLKAQADLGKAQKQLDALVAETPPADLTPKQQEDWEKKHVEQVNKANAKVDKALHKVDKAQADMVPKAGKRWVALTVFVTEGVQYTTGELTVEGNTVFEDPQILALIPLRQGVILDNGRLQAGIRNITTLYGNRGYLYANVVRQIKRHEAEPVADVQVSIVEDQAYYVDTIEFSGNNSTQDNVMRREFILNEGDLFSRTKLDLSVTKLNQLGFVRAEGEPIIQPLEGENKVNISVPVIEEGRNQIQIGGGYSGAEGAFFTGLYSTRNFMGHGQIFSLSLQVGGSSSRYALSFVEPWFLNKPYTLGFSLFSRDIDYGNDLSSSGEGFGIVLGKQVGVFSTARLNYNYENITSTSFTVAQALEDAVSKVSSITPSYNFNKVANPLRPNRGWSLQAQMQIAGGPLGGNTSFLKPVLNYIGYRKAMRKSYFAFHAGLGWVREWQGGTTADVATVDGLPRFERFWIGGDTFGPRIFETRTITPRRFVQFCRVDSVAVGDCTLSELGQILDVRQNPVGLDVTKYDQNLNGVLDANDLVELGGDRFYLLQGELVYPLNQQFELALFVDAGNALFEDTPWSFTDVRISAGVEMRFILPVFPAPLRLIYGIPIEESPLDRTSSFTFAIGRSF